MEIYLYKSEKLGNFGYKEITAESKEEADKVVKDNYPLLGYEYKGILSPTFRETFCNSEMCGLSLEGAKPQYTYDDDSPENGG